METDQLVGRSKPVIYCNTADSLSCVLSLEGLPFPNEEFDFV
jgi:hypothetical protein